MSEPYFESAASWEDAQARLTFDPIALPSSLGLQLLALRVHVRDHRGRSLAAADRTLEAHYDGFVFTQARKGATEAKRLAIDVRYGASPRQARIGTRDARIYELGPVPPPDDVDGRSPAVVAWHDDEMFYFLASGERSAEELWQLALAVYAVR